MDRVRIGVIGCGDVAFRHYLPDFSRIAERATVVALYDRDRERADAASRAFDAPVFESLDALLGSPEVDAVINITPPRFHTPINMAVLQAGKHLLTEKPLAGSVAEADTLIEAARSRDLIVVCAPAVAISAMMKDLRHLVHRGAIGTIASARAQLTTFGPAAWRVYTSDPTWFYEEGAGPLMDLAVYPLHMLTEVLGPARRLTAFSGISVPRRTVLAGPAQGKEIEVTVDDNTQILLDFGNNTFAHIDASYCAWATPGPVLELYGSEGVLVIDDIYDRHAAVRMWRPIEHGGGEWQSPPHLTENHFPTRGSYIFGGVEHFVDCVLRGERNPLLSAEHARHVLEIMQEAPRAAHAGRVVELSTSFPYPKAWSEFEKPRS